MNRSKISSGELSIASLLLEGNLTFKIPDFQRDFVWSHNEIKELLDDFEEDSAHFEIETDELSGYLLGNIVLIGDGKQFEVIDGQQRLTTLTILFKALVDYAIEKSNDPTAEYREQWNIYQSSLLKGYSITNALGEKKGLKIEHDSSLPFGEYYHKLMNDGLDDDFEPEKEADKNMQSIYNYIIEFFNSENMSEKKIIHLISYLTENVFLIMTTAPNESKAFQLFEVLNDRGRSLEPLDLIKNMFLKVITHNDFDGSKREEFLKHWSSFNENLEYPSLIDKRRKKISSSRFLSSYILAFEGENIKKSKLFEHFKKNNEENNTNELIKLAENLSYVSKIYSRLDSKQYDVYLPNNDNLNLLYELLDNEQSKSMLMPFYNLDTKDKEKILDSITRYVASILYSFTQANQIESFIPKMTSLYKKTNDIDEVIKLVDAETSKFAYNIRESLPLRRLESKNGTVPRKVINIYRFIERYYGNNIEALYLPNGKKLSLEHIMSRKLTIYDYSLLNFNDEEDFNQHLNRIGNLTLVYSTDNASMGNKSFRDKVPHFKNSDFMLTKKLGTNLKTEVRLGKDTKLYKQINKYISTPVLKKDQKHFTKEMIEKRSYEICNLLADVLTATVKNPHH